jgi:hypothetical protein
VELPVLAGTPPPPPWEITPPMLAGEATGMPAAVAEADTVGGLPTLPTEEQKSAKEEIVAASVASPFAAIEFAQLDTALSKTLGIQTALL